MASLLIAIIYISFISLGLPDSLLGSGWPVMHSDFGVSVSMAGIISTIVTGGTIISSLASDKINRRIGTGLITALSVAMTAISLLGFSFSNSYTALCLWSIPYGLGAGGVDAALNNYVALHYSARHMSWLHCFWGVGASISPYIMSMCISRSDWRHGYSTVAVIQIVLTVLIFASLPLWKKRRDTSSNDAPSYSLSLVQVLKLRGAVCVLIAFLAYCAMETTAGLWASTYLVSHKGIDPLTAARFGSLFYLGITFGRFICGFLTVKFSDKVLIRSGLGLILFGTLLMILPLNKNIFALSGLMIIGIGGAPVYPSIIHSTPDNFGRENSQAIIGVQMASAYTGSAVMPPVFGFLAEYISSGIYPYYLALFALIALLMTEKLNKLNKNSQIGK